MTTVWELLAGSIVLGWVFHLIPASRNRDRHAALSYAFGATFCVGSLLAGLSFGGLWVATLEPFGVMLPALCLRSSARKIGFCERRVPRWDLLVLMGLMLIVVLGAAGTIPFHPYAWFYSGLGAGALALGLCAWAFWRRQIVVLSAVFLAQILWLADVGSSNFYDHVAHLALIPAFLIAFVSPRR